MAIEVERLDNRRFQDIVDEAKRRINAYSPEWTNHNLSDPGIALVELFAWMTEMTLFQLNQVPEREMKVLLDAVGFELFPAQAASADLTFFVAAGNTSEVVVPTGTTVAAPLDGQQVFETEDELRILQPQLAECRAQRADGTITDTPGRRRRDDGLWEIRFEDGLACFDGLDAARASWADELGRLDPPQRAGWRPPDRFTGDVVYFGFEQPLARALIRAHFSVSTVRGLGIDPDEPPLIWEASTSSSAGWRRCRMRGVDTSAGMNRHGTMDVQIGDVHEPMPLRGTERELYWIRVRIDLESREVEHVYMASPVLQSIAFTTIGGTIHAANAVRHERQAVGVSDGLPGQRIRLHDAVLGAGGRTVEVWVGDAFDEPWEVRDDFAGATESSKVLVVDEAAGEIAFGPLLHQESGLPRQCGAVPPAGATIYASYSVGGGPDGNVPAGRITSLQTAITAVDRVTNVEPASGGVAAETLAEALDRAPTAVRAGERAVTASDFERIVRDAARDVHSVACRPPAAPGGAVRLLVVPQVSTTPSAQRIDHYALSPSLCRRIEGHLEPRRLVGTDVELTTPYYLGVSVMMHVRRTSQSSSHHLRNRLLRLVYTHVNPIVGGDHGKGLGYGETLTAEWFEDRLRHVEGVDAVEVVLFEVDLRQGTRVPSPTRRIELPPDTLFMSYRHAVVFEGETTP